MNLSGVSDTLTSLLSSFATILFGLMVPTDWYYLTHSITVVKRVWECNGGKKDTILSHSHLTTTLSYYNDCSR